jgi:curved DNA-binding protein CbpA
MAPKKENFIAWLKNVDKKSYYEILGVKPKATGHDIKEAFHEFALLCHPDRYVDDALDLRQAASEAFKRGAEAYRVLSRPDVRTRYDKALALGKKRFDEKSLDDKPPPPRGKTLEEVAKTPRGKAYAVKADRLLTVGKLEDARLQLVTALQHEPDNAELKERLNLIYEALALEPL